MLVVIALIGILAAISFPALTSGIDSLRLTQASDGVVTFLNSALTHAERRQQVVEISISIPEKSLRARSADGAWTRALEMPQGVTITHILPDIPGDPEAARQFFVYPGGSSPRVGVEVTNARGVSRMVRVDPISGIARVERTR
jgi:type II secretory pathway pseudopilin PulG